MSHQPRPPLPFKLSSLTDCRTNCSWVIHQHWTKVHTAEVSTSNIRGFNDLPFERWLSCDHNVEGIFHYSTFQVFHYSTFNFSIIPLFQYSIIPLFHFSTTPSFSYSTIPLFNYSIIQLFYLSTAFQLFQLFYFSTIPLFYYSTIYFSTIVGRTAYSTVSALAPRHLHKALLTWASILVSRVRPANMKHTPEIDLIAGVSLFSFSPLPFPVMRELW